MICPNCHSENKDGAKFCNDCGFPLTGRMATVAAASTSDEALRAFAAEDTPLRDVSVDKVVSTESDTLEEDDLSADEQASALNDQNIEGEEADPVVLSVPEISPKHPSQGSGPIDPASLPVIGVAGVDVDEDGNAFDFGDIDSFDEAKEKGEVDELRAMEPERKEPASPNVSADITADLSGLDECLVDAGYAPPQSSWRSGGTMEMPRVEGKPAPKQKEFRAPDPHAKKRGKGRVVAILLVVLVVAGIAAGGITYQMELWGGKMIPDVANKTQADATYLLEEKGFSVRVLQAKSDETEGVVLLMDPGAGSRAEQGTEIAIHVAVARIVPDVKGKTKDEAAKLFESEGFDHVTYAAEKSAEPEGTVLAVDPAAGEKKTAATPITVTVARPYMVPDVAGLSYDETIAAVESESYLANVLYTYTEDVAEGTILGTDPAAGTKLEAGATVTVHMAKSRASELVAAAQAFLSSAGTVQIGGTSYAISSVDAVSYLGNNQTSFTVTAAAVTTLDGETVRGSAKQKSGTITWDNANQIVSIA